MNGALSVRPEVPAWRLITTMALAGVLAGALIVIVHQSTQPTILRYKAEMLRRAVNQVLKQPERYETLYIYRGALIASVPEGVQSKGLDRLYVGYGADDQAVGFAIAAAEPGFQDIVRLIFGYDAMAGRLLGMKVLESKETPGLGDKIEKDAVFVSQFDGAATPLVGVKGGRGSDDPGEIDMITGATISSRAVIRIINNALERSVPLIAAREASR